MSKEWFIKDGGQVCFKSDNAELNGWDIQSLVDCLNGKEQKISDLEAKLAKSEKLTERLQQIVDKLRDKEFAGKTLVEAVNAVYEPLYKNKYDEAEELKKQLQEKEKEIRQLDNEKGMLLNNSMKLLKEKDDKLKSQPATIKKLIEFCQKNKIRITR